MTAPQEFPDPGESIGPKGLARESTRLPPGFPCEGDASAGPRFPVAPQARGGMSLAGRSSEDSHGDLQRPGEPDDDRFPEARYPRRLRRLSRGRNKMDRASRMPGVRPRRLLRFLASAACDGAFRKDAAPR